MNKIYNTQEEIASAIKNYLLKVDPSIRKTQLNIIPYIMIGMIDSESIVACDIAKKLKDNFSLVKFDSVIKRIRRLFNNSLFNPYSFYESIITDILKNYKYKFNGKVHIIFDHMYSKDNYTVFMFSLRIGKQGIPLLFRCFEGDRDPNAFTDETIINCIKTINSYFNKYNYKLVFLADRWFNTEKVLSTIEELGHTYCIRIKGNLVVSYYDKQKYRNVRILSGDLKGKIYTGKYYKDIYLYDNSNYKTNIVISRKIKNDEPWIIATNGKCNEAVKYYSYRFGGIECIFKNQKSNGFNLEKVSNANLKAFTSMFSIMCFSLLFITIIGADYCRNQSRYKNNKIETHKKYKGIKYRMISIFNTGLIIFHRAYYSTVNFRLPLHFTLYDV